MSIASTTIRTRPRGSAVCRVCALAPEDLEGLTSALDHGVPVAEVAQKYGISIHSIYRHQRTHARLRVLDLDDEDSSLPLVDKVLGIFDRARVGSERAYAAGDLRQGGVLGDSALRAVTTLASLGVNSDKLLADTRKAEEVRRSAFRLARTVEMASELDPTVAEILATSAEQLGFAELAADLRADDDTDAEGVDHE